MRPRPDPVGPGQESVWSYPRPPVAAPCQAHIEIAHRGVMKTVPSLQAFGGQHYNSLTSWGVDAKGEIKHVYA